MGVSLIPQMAADKKSGCRYVSISDVEATRTIGAVVLRGRSQTRANLSFLTLLRQLAD
jgi:hypothetical protein